MTARQEVRTGSPAAARDTWSIETQRAPTVGEILQTARTRKGVDLVRAERETKIRARHLMALESGDFNDLPATVYAKGFLRNYSRYLELDPDEMLSRWRREVNHPRSTDVVKVAPPPRPITAPRRGLKLTSGLLVATVLAVIVVGFVGYVGLQLVRFSQNPEIELRGPSVRWLSPDATSIVLSGSATPQARVTASGAGDLVRTTTADAAGSWTVELPVGKGRNDFSVLGSDPETGRDSELLQVIATVPVIATADPDARPTPALPGASTTTTGPPSAEVDLTSPSDRSTARDGKVKVAGTSDAESVLVSFQWLGKKGDGPPPPEPVELPVTVGGFRGTFNLPNGRWQVAVAGEVGGGVPGVATRVVKSEHDEIVAKVEAVGGFTHIKITADGKVVSAEGLRLAPGESAKFHAKEELIIRVGNAKAAHVKADGVDYGAMGKRAESMTWLIEKGQQPQVVP